MARHDIVVIGTSSGGVEALVRLFGSLPEDLPAAVFVVVHFPQGAPSVLPSILNRAGSLKAVNPEDGDAIKSGCVYVAPPNFHLLVEDGRVRLGGGPRENRHRLAADPLFRSAALAYGPRVVGVILTDARDEGAWVCWSSSAAERGRHRPGPGRCALPRYAGERLRYVDVGHCVPLDKIAFLLDRVTREETKEEGAYPVSDDMELESKLAGLDPTTIDSDERPGEISGFTCPECSGPLYEIQEGQLVRFRCRVGHAHTADSMLDEKAETLENALYVALNTLEESAVMTERLAGRPLARARARARRRALRGAGAGREGAGGSDTAGPHRGWRGGRDNRTCLDLASLLVDESFAHL